ncbi:MAG: bifunctional glutamate N-acetyltransferase/amino-acid acetyltransferase ArgJ [Coriobacteriia bacterium]|nr:bifunctional glutamate N-acetyltransferase/amino-acid acetyltransferase ArgJ [Coriobacteriia bacterium]
MDVLPVKGFKAGALASGLRKHGRLDLALIYADEPVACAGIFTQSRVVAAPVTLSREHVSHHKTRGFIVNSGNANACTGAVGMKTAHEICRAYARVLSADESDILCASTGVIGVALDGDKVTSRAVELVEIGTADSCGLENFAQAIMTTDTSSKICSKTFSYAGHTCTVTGIAKGSGMIKPNMATMIGVLLTDAPLSGAMCEKILYTVSQPTFNSVTVDGDTSTNDTLICMASAAVAAPCIGAEDDDGYEQAVQAFFEVSDKLAKKIASDGEGATKEIEIIVTGARTSEDARQVAFTIAESPLVKTAVFGSDANWGRVAMAAGRAGVVFDQNDMRIEFAGIPVCERGTALPFDEEAALAALNKSEVQIHIDLGERATSASDIESAQTCFPHPGVARVLTCDLTYDYVRINGEYRS